MSDQPRPEQTVDLTSANDLNAGLAAAFRPGSGPPLPVGHSVLKVLGAGLPGVPHVRLRDPDSAAGPVPPSAPGDPADRYQWRGEIARGGMGAVLRGRDEDLGRDVAVKVLLEAHAGRPDLVHRF